MRKLGERGAYPLLRLTFGGGVLYHRGVARTCAARSDLGARLHRRVRTGALRCVPLHRCSGEHRRRCRRGGRRARRRHRRGAHKGCPAARTALRGLGSTVTRCPGSCAGIRRLRSPQDAGMTLPEFEDFLYGSCLVDWEAEHRRISHYAKLFDGAEEVRIVGEGTDLRLSVAGRRADVDAGHREHAGRRGLPLPGGDVGATETIAFTEFPAQWGGRSAWHPPSLLGRPRRRCLRRERRGLLSRRSTQTTGPPDRRAGHRLQPRHRPLHAQRLLRREDQRHRPPRARLGFEYLGGTNTSAIHWDIVKDLRSSGRIELDGKIVQKDGVWIDSGR